MKILNAIVAMVFSLSATTALSAEGAGTAMAVIDAASAKGQAGSRSLVVGADVFVGDLVQTDAAGEAQLLFGDGTRMVVGANSSLVIEEFLFRGKAAENTFAVKALGGAFRFISGDSGDENYVIRTPTGTIGVRGTAFDFTVMGDGSELIILEGSATMCNEGDDPNSTEDDDCETIATPCAVLRDDDDDKEVAEIPPGKQREELIGESFPYVVDDSELREDFQVAGHPCAPGGLAGQALGPVIPAEAIVVGGVVIVGGVIIGILLGGDSNNNTNK